MTKSLEPEDIEFGGPARYRIVVQGVLGKEWSSRLAGMELTITERKDKASLTTLVGPLRDQAELNGVLETLYGLHLSVIKVETVRDKGEIQ